MSGSRFARAPLDTQSPFGDRPFTHAARIAWSAATARFLPRGLRKKIRKRFARRFPGPFDCTADGIRMRVYPAENHSDRIVAGRGELPEIPERRLLSGLMRNGMAFVDIGANVGVYSLHVARSTGGTAQIVAFEPHPRTFAKLVYNCQANGFGSVSCINTGIGPQDGEALLFSDGGGNIGGASMLREAAGAAVSVPVSVRPLGPLLRESGLKSVDLLKIDIEGFEDRALVPFLRDPANESLFPRNILIETVHRHLWRADLAGRLAELGYHETARTNENLLFTRDSAP